jgi:hypothetical protein
MCLCMGLQYVYVQAVCSSIVMSAVELSRLSIE